MRINATSLDMTVVKQIRWGEKIRCFQTHLVIQFYAGRGRLCPSDETFLYVFSWKRTMHFDLCDPFDLRPARPLSLTLRQQAKFTHYCHLKILMDHYFICFSDRGGACDGRGAPDFLRVSWPSPARSVAPCAQL